MPTVDINGTQVEYDSEWAASWEVTDLLTVAEDDSPVSDYEKLAAMFKIVQLCTGIDKPHFIDMCGGGRTNRTEMAQHLGKTIGQLVPKN